MKTIPIINRCLAWEAYLSAKSGWGKIDPWRLFEKPKLFRKVIKAIIDVCDMTQIDYIMSVSDFGMPIAIGIVNQCSVFKGQICLLSPTNSENWCLPKEATDMIESKQILLVDDILNTGLHAKKAMTFIREKGGNIYKYIPLFDNRAEPYTERRDKIISDPKLTVCCISYFPII